MQCPNCNYQNRPGVKFCAHCGKPLPQQPVAAPSPAYQPPPAPPPPAAVPPPAYQAPPTPPPVPIPPAAPAVQPLGVSGPGIAARRIQWKNIAIGCGIYVLGLLCGMLILAGVLYGPDWLRGVIPSSSPSPTLQTPASSPSLTPQTPPPAPQTPPPTSSPKPSPAPKPLLWIEPGLGAISVETANVSSDEFPAVYTNARERFLQI